MLVLVEHSPALPGGHSAARLALEFGGAVRMLREERGWSQTQLAQAAGMTQSAVARFEAGGMAPTLLLERLARAYDVKMAERFTPKTTAA